MLEVGRELERDGYEVTYLPVDRQGRLDKRDFVRALRPDTLLVSIMHANNETGVVFPVADLARITKETDRSIIFHTDATQSVGKLPIDLSGNFQATVPLGVVVPYLNFYAGIADKSATELYLVGMIDSSQASAVYRFDKTGAFQNQANLTPPIYIATGVAFDGTDAYVNQNAPPYLMYRVDPETGDVLQTYDSNPGHGQRLGLEYWHDAGLLIETYDEGISFLQKPD